MSSDRKNLSPPAGPSTIQRPSADLSPCRSPSALDPPSPVDAFGATFLVDDLRILTDATSALESLDAKRHVEGVATTADVDELLDEGSFLGCFECPSEIPSKPGRFELSPAPVREVSGMGEHYAGSVGHMNPTGSGGKRSSLVGIPWSLKQPDGGLSLSQSPNGKAYSRRTQTDPMVAFDPEERVDYTRYTNRQLAAIPLAVLAVAILIIGGQWATTGAPVDPSIEFSGGTELDLVATGGESAIRAAFDVPIASIRSIPAEANSYVVTFDTEATSAQVTELADVARDAGFTVEAQRTTSASFGESTQRLAILGIGVAFIAMSIVVFLLFRTFVPSIAVVISAFSDMVIPVAMMNLLGIKLSLGTVAALLMLIGYSVDSDILLNNYILRRRGGFYETAYDAMRTGVTMTLTSLSAVIVMAIVAGLFGVDLLWAIGVVLAFGLATDLMNTYMLNLSLLRWYRGVTV